MDGTALDRRALLTAAAGFAASVAVWSRGSPWIITGSIAEVVGAVEAMVSTDRGFEGLAVGSYSFSGAAINYGDGYGVAVSRGDRRNAVRMSRQLARDVGSLEAAKGAVASLLEWAAHV